MVCDVNFIVPTVREPPTSSEMFKTVVALLQIYITLGAIVTQIGIDRDIRSAFLYVFLGLLGFWSRNTIGTPT